MVLEVLAALGQRHMFNAMFNSLDLVISPGQTMLVPHLCSAERIQMGSGLNVSGLTCGGGPMEGDQGAFKRLNRSQIWMWVKIGRHPKDPVEEGR